MRKHFLSRITKKGKKSGLPKTFTSFFYTLFFSQTTINVTRILHQSYENRLTSIQDLKFQSTINSKEKSCFSLNYKNIDGPLSWFYCMSPYNNSLGFRYLKTL